MRRSLLSTILFSLIAFYSFAQVGSGSKFLGGTFSVFSSKNKVDNGTTSVSTDGPTSFAIIPSFGFFVSDNIAVGLGLGYAQTKQVNNVSPGIRDENTQSLFVVNPFFRYYAPTSSDNFYFFGQLGVNLGFGKDKQETISGPTTVTTEADLTEIGVNLSPGFAFFPSEKWGIELIFQGLGFSSSTTKLGNVKSTDTEIVFDIRSFSPSLGVLFYF